MLEQVLDHKEDGDVLVVHIPCEQSGGLLISGQLLHQVVKNKEVVQPGVKLYLGQAAYTPDKLHIGALIKLFLP